MFKFLPKTFTSFFWVDGKTSSYQYQWTISPNFLFSQLVKFSTPELSSKTTNRQWMSEINKKIYYYVFIVSHMLNLINSFTHYLLWFPFRLFLAFFCLDFSSWNSSFLGPFIFAGLASRHWFLPRIVLFLF